MLDEVKSSSIEEPQKLFTRRIDHDLDHLDPNLPL